jgi:hypothetical protein
VTPEEILKAGNLILAEVLLPAGFALGEMQSGKASGGPLARVRWLRGQQFIELHVRGALGIVLYGWAGEVFDHRHVVGGALSIRFVSRLRA